ncbi:glycosyltransferase family 2 protein [uncultured Treponema sp.]|uniref:glycosyltransferase family 2 protein n=1 Tax=uncultured Treponema sp. TaxID=162155 RepID=UPI00280BCEFF|nr:glycosyltransferase family 2 protein [uncultured Treponema sp.]
MKTDNSKIGIVTVLYNSEKVLDDFFDSLNRQTYTNCIVYIIDNLSTDNSINKTNKLIEHCKYPVKFLLNNQNFGVAKGNNQGIIQALADNCDYILLSNNDVVLEDDTIEKLFDGLVQNKADLVVPKIFLYENKNLWCAGGKMDFFNTKSIQFGYNKPDQKKFSKVKRIAYAPTCFMLINKYVFYDIGLMDEKYFVYYDDTDFIYRCKKLNKKLFYIPTSCMKHKESICTGKRSNFFYHYIYRNKIYYLSKYNKFWKLFFIVEFIYNYTIRKIKMKDTQQIKNISKALKEGYLLSK